MAFWRNKAGRLLASATVPLSLAYPGLVYFGHGSVSPGAFVGAALALILLRLAVAGPVGLGVWIFPLFGTALGLVAVALYDVDLAVRFYPVLMSLGVGALFGVTLAYPPSLIERFARIREPDLPPEGVVYCRRVTMVWTAFALFNASVAGWASLWGTLEIWSLWTGLVSYVLIGLLFVGEFAFRTRLWRRRT